MTLLDLIPAASLVFLCVSVIGLGGYWIGNSWIRRDTPQSKYVGGLDVCERIERLQEQEKDYARPPTLLIRSRSHRVDLRV
jgi:hypothetical protein